MGDRMWNTLLILLVNTDIMHRDKLLMAFAEMGTNNIISIAQRKPQLCFQPVKAQRRMRNWIFKISDMQCNFCYVLFDSVEVQRNSTIAERHFRTKLKRNITSAIEISQYM